jgi:hypothetical protein
LARRPQYSSKIIGSQKTRRSDVGVSGCGAGVLAAVACSRNPAQWSLSDGDHANPGLSSVIQTFWNQWDIEAMLLLLMQAPLIRRMWFSSVT